MNVWTGIYPPVMRLKGKLVPGVVKTIKKRERYSGASHNIKPIKNYLNISFHD